MERGPKAWDFSAPGGEGGPDCCRATPGSDQAERERPIHGLQLPQAQPCCQQPGRQWASPGDCALEIHFSPSGYEVTQASCQEKKEAFERVGSLIQERIST